MTSPLLQKLMKKLVEGACWRISCGRRRPILAIFVVLAIALGLRSISKRKVMLFQKTVTVGDLSNLPAVPVNYEGTSVEKQVILKKGMFPHITQFASSVRALCRL